MTVRPGEVQVRSGSVEQTVLLDPLAPPSTGWLPTRDVSVPGGRLLLEDGDPYRDCYGQPVEPRLEVPAARALGRTLTDAWRVVRRDVPAHAAALDGGLRAVVALAPDPARPLRSATARHAFGAVAVTPHPDPETMAAPLVHEWQHAKLGAVLDLYDLVEPWPGHPDPGALAPRPATAGGRPAGRVRPPRRHPGLAVPGGHRPAGRVGARGPLPGVDPGRRRRAAGQPVAHRGG